MSIEDRLADADILWKHGRHEGALLSVLVAVAATARKTFPEITGDRASFEAFMKTTHGWTIGIEYRGQVVDLDHLFYKWLRCELVHTAALPVDLRIEDQLGDPNANSVRAGGAPDYTVLLGPAGTTSSSTPSGTLPPTPTSPEPRRTRSCQRGWPAAYAGAADADSPSSSSTIRAISEGVSGGRPGISVWRRMYSSSEGRSDSHGHSASRG